MSCKGGRPMPSELDALLPLAECVRPRKPRELRGWVLAKCNLFAQVPELRGPVLLHEGLFKWFHEEIYPLSVFAVARYGDSDDVFCVPKRDQSYDVDAEVREASRTIQIEITSARAPHEHLRMEAWWRPSLGSPGRRRKGSCCAGRSRVRLNEVEFVD